MIPLLIFIIGLIFIFLMGIIVFIRSIFFQNRPLNKGDVYLRGSIFLCSLFLTISTSTGIYIGDQPNSVGSIDFDEYFLFIPFIISIVSLLATMYAWLIVFANTSGE